MSGPTIEVKNLEHSYGDVNALKGIDFKVNAGEIFGILGPNGGGKTTLFRIISTLIKPTGGTATICGHDVSTAQHEVRRSIGVVFQSPSLDLALSVQENLKHQGHLYGLRGKALDTRITEVLTRLGVIDRSKDRAEILSGGLKRRVEIAKGLLHTPQVLLLDEPSTGLDPGVRQELWRYLTDLRDNEDMTILLTTHFMDEAARCDKLALIDRGEIVAIGTPDELTSTIGGDIVTLETADAESLKMKISEKFGGEPFILAGSVRVERTLGHEFIAEVVDAFGDDITGIRLGKPSLEDIFIQKTGRHLWDDGGKEKA